MKLVKRIWCSTVLLMLAMVKMVYAGEPIGNASLEYHEPSVLLQSPVLESEDNARGIRLSAGVLQITNGEDGTLHITVETFAHKEVDKSIRPYF